LSTIHAISDKCRRRNVVSFKVEPEEPWRTVVLNRWKSICPSCFDVEASAGVRYRFAGAVATSRSDMPEQAAALGRSICECVAPQAVLGVAHLWLAA
jgi:hypothetical protein